MKNKLLISTALFGFTLSMPALALTDGVAETGETLSGVYENQSGRATGGVALINAGVENVSVSDGTVFKNNSSTSYGGALANSGSVKIGNNVTFETNTSAASGAIHNSTAASTGPRAVMTIGDNVKFLNNTATEFGGAVINHNADLTIGNNALFENNKSGDGHSAGAIANQSNGEQISTLTIGSGATFKGNEGKSGGAIYQYANGGTGSTTNIGENAVFENNKALTGNGGAIGIYSGAVSLKDGATFTGNSAANGEGGALYLADFDDQPATMSQISNARFVGNTAKDGAAVSLNTKGATKISGSYFENNKASAADGAALKIGADQTVNFENENTFVNNGAADIKNDGSIKVASGSTLSLDGGISGAGTADFASNTTLNVKQGVTKIENKVSTEGTKLNINFSGKTDSIDLNDIFTNEANQNGFDKMEIGANGLYAFVRDGDNSSVYNAQLKSSENVSQDLGISQTDADIVLAMAAGGNETGNARFNAVADAVSAAAQSGDGRALRDIENMGASASPIVRTVQTDLHNMIFSAATAEMDNEDGAIAQGRSSGDYFNRVKVWIRGLYNYLDKDKSGKTHGFTADTYGVALGIDKEIDNDVTLGVGYAYSQTDVSAHGRDTDIDTNTAILYGQYKPTNWFVNAVASYNWSTNKEKKSFMGYRNHAKYDVDSFGMQVMTGYDTIWGTYDLTPQVGLRYLHINRDSYHDQFGSRIDSDKSDILTGVAGAKFSKYFTLNNGVLIRPEVSAALTYDFVSDGNSSNVLLANGASYQVEGEKLKRFGFEVGAKAAVDLTCNLELSIGYEGRFRKDYSDHTGMATLKYAF